MPPPPPAPTGPWPRFHVLSLVWQEPRGGPRPGGAKQGDATLLFPAPRQKPAALPVPLHLRAQQSTGRDSRPGRDRIWEALLLLGVTSGFRAPTTCARGVASCLSPLLVLPCLTWSPRTSQMLPWPQARLHPGPPVFQGVCACVCACARMHWGHGVEKQEAGVVGTWLASPRARARD